jgi:hypothetical protein
MASNTNKRIPIKHIRDRAKSAYSKQANCYICGCEENLELHHLHSLTRLLNAWAEKNSHDLSTDESVLEIRDEFIAEHMVEIYDMVYTLCNKHHVALHGVYGKAPLPSSPPKQERWIQLQKAKYEDGYTPVEKHPSISFFGQFT